MSTTITIRTHEVRIGDYVEMPDGTRGEITNIRDHGTKVVFRLVDRYDEISYHILTDDQTLAATLEDDAGATSDVEVYGAGSR